jgi:hypothetical protein
MHGARQANPDMRADVPQQETPIRHQHHIRRVQAEQRNASSSSSHNGSKESGMKDYSAMSDIEINKSVAISSGKNVKLIKLDSDDQECAVIVGEKFTVEKKEFDPCNNPSDAWPIITENRITLVAPMSYDSTQDWMAYPAHDSDLSPTDEKPLRAAMIAFLMLKDAEKGHG